MYVCTLSKSQHSTKQKLFSHILCKPPMYIYFSHSHYTYINSSYPRPMFDAGADIYSSASPLHPNSFTAPLCVTRNCTQTRITCRYTSHVLCCCSPRCKPRRRTSFDTFDLFAQRGMLFPHSCWLYGQTSPLPTRFMMENNACPPHVIMTVYINRID